MMSLLLRHPKFEFPAFLGCHFNCSYDELVIATPTGVDLRVAITAALCLSGDPHFAESRDGRSTIYLSNGTHAARSSWKRSIKAAKAIDLDAFVVVGISYLRSCVPRWIGILRIP